MLRRLVLEYPVASMMQIMEPEQIPSIGDVFYLQVLDETLAYQVDQINTVLPHDTTYLGITESSWRPAFLSGDHVPGTDQRHVLHHQNG